jgi:hypothetical protein
MNDKQNKILKHYTLTTSFTDLKYSLNYLAYEDKNAKLKDENEIKKLILKCTIQEVKILLPEELKKLKKKHKELSKELEKIIEYISEEISNVENEYSQNENCFTFPKGNKKFETGFEKSIVCSKREFREEIECENFELDEKKFIKKFREKQHHYF